jgi:hypothetical protein
MPISEKSSKIKFLKKFQKIIYKFLCKKWGRETPGRHQGGSHATSHIGGAAQPWPRHPGVRGPHLAPHLSLPPLFFLSPENKHSPSSNSSSCCSCLDFSISLLSPSFMLRFRSFALRYVTPLLVQVEFLLVKYFVSILAL